MPMNLTGSGKMAFVAALYTKSVAQQLLRPCPVPLPADEAETGQWLMALHLPGVERGLHCWHLERLFQELPPAGNSFIAAWWDAILLLIGY